MNSGSVQCFAIVVSWRTVRCLTAAPYEEAQFRKRSQSACDISATGKGFMVGTLENGIVSSGLGYHDLLLVRMVIGRPFSCSLNRFLHRQPKRSAVLRGGKKKNRKKGEMAQKKLGGGRNRGKKVGRREKKKSWE